MVSWGVWSVWRFTTRRPSEIKAMPPVTLLRPLCGTEPGLDQALATLCMQNYPTFQLILGVQATDDAALPAVNRLQRRFPHVDIAVTIDPAMHGRNRKVGNLINMLPRARHDILVFSDSDLHVAPDYLQKVVAALAAPGVGLVTTLSTGLPTVSGMAARLGALQMTCSFLPGALLSRRLGRQDCLGTTMALRRRTLAEVGGLEALADHLADDNVLGQLVQRLGLSIALADTIPAAAVSETSLAALWQHELRWARTIGALKPTCFLGSALQFPITWAVLAWLCSEGSPWASALVALAWGARALATAATMQLLSPRHLSGRRASFHLATAALLPMRDVLSVALVAVSYMGTTVQWRGHLLTVDSGACPPR